MYNVLGSIFKLFVLIFPLWYSVPGFAQVPGSSPLEPELETHPLYRYLVQEKYTESYRRLFVGYRLSALMLEANTVNPSQMGSSKLIPAIGINLEFWPLRSFGLSAHWTRGLLTFIPVTDPQNQFLKSADFIRFGPSYRHYFSSIDDRSYLQVSAGVHFYNFPLIVDESVPWVRSHYGPGVGLQRQLQLASWLSVRGGVDLAYMLRVEPQQTYLIKGDGGVSIGFELEVTVGIINEEDFQTHMGLIYGQYDFLYPVEETFRSTYSSSSYTQTFRSIQLQFGAKL